MQQYLWSMDKKQSHRKKIVYVQVSFAHYNITVHHNNKFVSGVSI